MNIKDIRDKIKEIEVKIKSTPINIINTQYVKDLFEIHKCMWDFAYFKKYQEKDYLKKIIEKEDTNELKGGKE